MNDSGAVKKEVGWVGGGSQQEVGVGMCIYLHV